MLLSRLLITGPVNSNTPKCVLLEIADAHGIDYSSVLDSPKLQSLLLEKITTTSCPTIPYTISQISTINDRQSLQSIALFVNKNISWKSSALKTAFSHLYQFTTLQDFQLASIIYGEQTNDTPYHHNTCILYRICTLYHINLNYYTSALQMAQAVKLLSIDAGTILHHVQHFLSTDATKSNLISILLMNNTLNTINIEPVTSITQSTQQYHDLLQALYPSLTDLQQLRSRVNPTTNVGAIGLACMLYNIDISQATNPLNEFTTLKLDADNYIPSDPYMAYWHNLNNTIFDLTQNFNPTFPIEYYHDYHLNNLAINHGYLGAPNKTRQYEFLQLQYATDTFYLGQLPNLSTTELIIDFDDITNVPYGQLLTFGSKLGTLYPISISELIQTFTINRSFTNPFVANSIFSDAAITKLLSILQLHRGPQSQPLSPETIALQNTLIDKIYYVKSIYFPDDETKSFVAMYNNSRPETKDEIIKTLIAILHCGMYMRGWEGINHPYPIDAKIVSIHDQIIVDTQVLKTINNIESLCRGLGKIGVRILELPLVRYVDGKYLRSIYPDDGFTIGERLNLVKQGETTNNMSSCIRLSSNWICASAHKYIIALGQSPPFEITQLRKIS